MLEAQQWVGNGRYQLVRFLRAGGAGVVWEARDRRPRPGESAAVAIKVLDAAAGGAAAAEREAEGAARVQHPNVVRVRDTFTEDGLAFMVMELAVGSLADLVAREGPLPPPIALGCALQACEALAAAHRAGVVHRDVKPHNLLVFADGSVRLADFGAARALMDGHTRTRTGALLGSIPFMAPEQRRDARAVQPATDVYALSVTLGWLLLGEAPEEPWTEEAAAQLRSVRAPEGLVHAFAAAGARRPEDRPADGAALLEVLRGCGVVPAPVPMPEGWEGVREEAPGGTVKAAAGRGSRWTLGVLAGVLAGVLGVAGVAGVGAGWAGWGRGGDATSMVQTSAEGTADPPACADAVSEWVGDVHLGPRETVDAQMADVDGDGVLDALFPNQLDESLSVWWGVRGDFPAVRTDVKIGRSQRAPAVGDFDGDGMIDLVFGLPETEAIGWLHALANRTFSKLRSTFQGPAVKYLALADENRDGRLDLYIRTVGGFLDVRRSQADGWASGRLVTMLGEGSELAMARTRGPIPLLYTSTGTGTDSEVHIREGDGRLRSSWPGIQRWVPSPDDASGDAYGISRLGAVVRVAADGTTCKVGPENNTYRMFAVGDMNGDGLLDGLSTLTCRFCTSNHVFLRGVGEER